MPCKPKADPWKFLSVRKIVWNSVNGVKISYSRILGTKLNWVHETNIVITATVGLECRYVLMRNDRKVMGDLEPGEHMKKMFLQSVTQATRKKKKQELSKAVEPMTSIVFPRAVIHGDISTIGLKTCCKMRNNYPVKSLGTDFRNRLPHL